MKKKLVLTASTLLAVGLIASLTNNQGNTVRVEATEHFDVTIAKRKAASYSYYGNYNVCFADGTGDKEFWFKVANDDEIYENHQLTPNKIYTLDNMSASKSYATISGEKFDYVSASLKLYSDENDYIGYEAEVELNNGVSYSLHEAEPMSGEMVIDEYKDQYGQITLTDTETGSRFNFVISAIEDGVTYTLSDFISSKYCYIGQRYWNYREATFKRTTDEKGLIHVEATVLTEHGDSLSLKYDDPEPIEDTAAANAFANTFLSTTDGICVDSSKSSGDTNVSTLAAVWNVKETPDGSSLVEKWNALSIGAKSVFAEGTATEAIADAKARYVHIMSRYSEQLTAFDNGPVYIANARFGFGSDLSNDATFIVTIVVVIAISTLTLATFLVIKKRRYN